MKMDAHDLGRALGALLVPLIWAFAMATALWLTRKFFPSAERWLFAPVFVVIRRLAGVVRQARQARLRSDPRDLSRSAQRRAGRD